MSKPMGQENYEKFASHYAAVRDTKAHNAYYEQPAMLSMLPDVDGKRVLDAGCGPGVYTEWLLKNEAASVVAVDVTPEMIEIAKNRIGDNANGQVEFYIADLNQPLAFAQDAEFDLIICPLVLDYIEDWRPTFREFQRVLRAGGHFVFSVGHPMDDWQRWNTGNYFATERVEMMWGWQQYGGPFLIKSYRRPLQAMINPILAAGLILERILEPLPMEDFREADADSYGRLMREPGFILMRARK